MKELITKENMKKVGLEALKITGKLALAIAMNIVVTKATDAILNRDDYVYDDEIEA